MESDSSLFEHLLVSRDGLVDSIEFEKAKQDSKTGAILVPGSILVEPSHLGQIHTAIEYSTLDFVKARVEWTSRSVHCRLGFDVETIHAQDMHQTERGMIVPATFSFFPWENADGQSVENPLRALLAAQKEEIRIACGRLFMRPVERHALSAAEIWHAQERGVLDINGGKIVDGGVLLPVEPNERYPLRYDLMNKHRLMDAVMGSGRGAIDSIQPRIAEEAILQPHGFGVVSTRCSLLEHSGVLESRMVNQKTGKHSSSVHQKHSRFWDDRKTVGRYQSRHLEVNNVSTKPINAADYAVKLSLYPPYEKKGVTKSVVSRSLSTMQNEGLNLDHYLQADAGHEQIFRDILSSLDARDDLAGIVLGPNGVMNIRKERHEVQQDQAMETAADRFFAQGADPASDHYKDLCEYMELMGDPRQRGILFAKQAPSSNAIRYLMDRGIRSIVTTNIAQNDSKIYVSDSSQKHYRKLVDHGLNLYLVTPKIVRKMWHDFFVDVHSLERVKNTDVRFCIYCASATGADRLLELAEYPQFLEALQNDFPNAAIITGAAKNGAMQYANLVARKRGIVTMGVANHIVGQETTEDELDAGTFFDRDGFNPRQALMSRCGAIPLVGIGAQGSEFEGALERVHAKIGKSQLAPIGYIDPANLGKNGRHLWQPVMELEHQYTVTTDVEGGIPVQLTRSPYVANLTHLSTSYLEYYQTVIRPYMDDPIAFWKKCDVPDAMVRTAMEKTVRDSLDTGLPIPVYLRPVIEKLGISSIG